MNQKTINETKKKLMHDPELIQHVAMNFWMHSTGRTATATAHKEWKDMNYANRQAWVNRTWNKLNQFWNGNGEQNQEEVQKFGHLFVIDTKKELV
jgi:hypothetical protein